MNRVDSSYLMSWRMIEVPKVFMPLGPIFLRLNGCWSELLEVLALAAQFPARHHATLRCPVFGPS